MKAILSICLWSLLLTACAVPQDTYTPEPTTTTDAIEEPTLPSTAESIQTLTVYSPDEKMEGFTTEKVAMQEYNEATITEALRNAGVLTEEASINTLTLEETVLKADFNASFRDLINAQGSAGERGIMGSIVNTLLDAYGADSVLITVEGETLESGHVIYDFPLEFYE